MKKRDVALDIARGIVIFSVVLGHLDTGLKGQIIYLFHMPFFFIISGYLHKVERQEFKYFRRKCISLLLPYFVYLFIIRSPSILELLSRALSDGSAYSIAAFVKYIGKLLYGGESLRGDVGVFWFVTCLFLTQQIFNFISVRVSSQKRILAIATALYGVSFLDHMSPIQLGFPWAANVVCCAFFFYAAGSLYGHAIFKAKDRLLLGLALAVSVFSIVLIASGFNLSFSMKGAYYGFFILSPLAALAMTKLVSLVAEWLARPTWLASRLAFVGKASITIMFVHRAVEYSLPDSFRPGSLVLAVTITAICCVLHELFLKTSWSRVLFLGSRQDLAALTETLSRSRA